MIQAATIVIFVFLALLYVQAFGVFLGAIAWLVTFGIVLWLGAFGLRITDPMRAHERERANRSKENGSLK